MRDPHLLEPSKKNKIPRRMIFFDSEAKVNIEITDEEIYRAEQNQASKEASDPVKKEHDPYLICATFYRDRTKETGKVSEKDRTYYGEYFLENFWNDVANYNTYGETLYLLAHNAKYDMQVTGGVSELVLKHGYTVTGFSDDNPLILKFEKTATYIDKHGEERTKRKKILVLSSTNYFQQSLKSLGDIFNIPKLDFDHAREVEPSDPAFMQEAITYCKRDVEILKTAMLHFIDFIQRENLGSFAMTVAGQAFASFRQRFLDAEIYIHSDKRALDVERRAYAGGRNECFSIGKVEEMVFYYDINSMYPHVMKNYLYPTKLLSFWESCSVTQLREQIMEDKLVCCDCLIDTTLPMFHVKRGKLIFPTGTFWTTLSTAEIMQAMERGILREVKNVCLYEAGDIFSGYVDYFYTKRLAAKAAGDEVHQHLYKIFLNSLYGKFGQLNVKWERIGDAPPEVVEIETIYNPETRERRTLKTFGGGVFEQNHDPDDQEAYNSFPAVAAHVTAYARMLLWTFIEEAGMENVHYCDTDSLLVNSIGAQLLWIHNHIDNKELGKLKLEEFKKDGKKVPGIFCDLELFGCKDYSFAGISKTKGVSKNAKRLPDKDGKLRYAVTQWGGFSDRLKDGDFSTYYNKVIIKTLKREYDKGTTNGNRVTAFVLDAEAEEKERLKKEWEEACKKDDLFKYDHIREMCKLHGYMRVPQKGDRYYTEYTRSIPQKNKGKYFRLQKGLALDEWADAAGYEVNTLLEVLGK